MLKISTTLIAAVVAVSAFASHAEARSGGSFYASPFFRNQGRHLAHPHCAREESLRFEALERARERRLAEIRAERLARALREKKIAAQAAAAKRARLAAALEEKKAASAKAAQLAAANTSTSPANVVETVAPKSDLLSVASTTQTTTTTASLTKTAAVDQPISVAKTDAIALPDVCRKYSPAADGLIETPCK